MELWFSASRDKLNVNIKSDFLEFVDGVRHEYTLQLSADATNSLTRVVMLKRMRDDLDKHVSKIRQEEYERGWKDAKAKRAKSTWFPMSFSFKHNR